ncbi:cytochrome P450 [Streptomyces sp. SID12501]|uniref:cytochrome P450 n=1 Tax=Streptomyces sp. SID12501 TaxID=2706042 RepID=UPI0013DD31D3
MPEAPGGLPFLGHSFPLLRAPLPFLRSLASYGPLVQIRVGPFRAVVISSPSVTRELLVDDRTFDKASPLIDRLKDVLGDGLATCPHQRHRRPRRMLQPAFHPSRIPTYARTMSEQIESVVGGWQDGGVLDVLHEMQTVTTRITLATMFSTSLTPEITGPAAQDINVVLDSMYRRLILPQWAQRLPLPGNRRHRLADERLHATIMGVLNERRTSETEHDDLLSMLLAARDLEGDGHAFSDAELADHALTFYFAGIETAAVTLSWALSLLSQHPDVAARLHAEVDDVLAGRTPQYDDLPALPFTRAVLDETLRLYPPAWFLSRFTTKDTRLGDHTITAGTNIACFPYLVHHDAETFPEPERFDPDRWTAGSTVPRESFIPFGSGARKCIGDRFAVTETTLALAGMVAGWDFRPVAGSSSSPRIGATLRPRNLRMRTTRRALSLSPSSSAQS